MISEWGQQFQAKKWKPRHQGLVSCVPPKMTLGGNSRSCWGKSDEVLVVVGGHTRSSEWGQWIGAKRREPSCQGSIWGMQFERKMQHNREDVVVVLRKVCIQLCQGRRGGLGPK